MGELNQDSHSRLVDSSLVLTKMLLLDLAASHGP